MARTLEGGEFALECFAPLNFVDNCATSFLLMHLFG